MNRLTFLIDFLIHLHSMHDLELQVSDPLILSLSGFLEFFILPLILLVNSLVEGFHASGLDHEYFVLLLFLYLNPLQSFLFMLIDALLYDYFILDMFNFLVRILNKMTSAL